MDRSELNLHESFEKGIRNIYQIAAYIILAGNLLDLQKYAPENKILLISNTSNILIISFFLVGYYLKKFSFRTGFTVLVYTIVINIYVGKFVSFIDPGDPIRIYFFLRDSLFIVLLITLASFALNKIHSLIIGISYLIALLIFSIYIKSEFLNDSILLIIIVTVGFIGLTYYLVGLFERAMFDLQENSKMIQTQNNELNEINHLIKVRQKIIEDQSERLMIQADELRIKNHELNRLNESKNLFLSIIAHDLKNPFNVILGYAELLRKKYQTLTDEKRSRYIELIESTSVKTHNLLENLLNWSRSQTDKVTLNSEMIILNDIVQEVLDLYSENIKSKEIEIDYSPDLLYEVYADRDTMSLVVRNLISNAIKFSYNGSKILISIHEKDRQVTCMIKDYGVGIAPENIDKLFDIDKHLSSMGTTGETGTGLGLILCKIFIEQNKGKILVESHPNEGSSFSFTLPANITKE